MLYVIGAANTVPGSFASFSATTDNAGATFASGTLVLSNTVAAQGACLSTGGGTTDGNANTACDAFFDLAVRKPGDVATVHLTLDNVGSLDASNLAFGWSGANCTTTNAIDESYFGTGNLCVQILLAVQEYADAAAMAADDRTGGTCWYGDQTDPTSCALIDGKTLADFDQFKNANLIDGGPMPAADQRFFGITMQMRPAASNTVQGRSITATFTWLLEQ